MELKVNVEELESKTEEMAGVKSVMEELMGNMKSTVDSLSDAWNSGAGSSFIGRFGSVVMEINDSLTNLESHITKLKEAAEEYRNTESEVNNIINDLATDNIF